MSNPNTSKPNDPGFSPEDTRRGALHADKVWDDHIRHKNFGYFVGFVMRLFALWAASNTPIGTQLVFESIRRGIESLGIMKQPPEGH